jgi:long-chain acyl-CoA synthetase
MFARTLLVSFALYAVGLAVHAAEIEGVRIDDRVYIAQGVPELVLNGAGVRRKLVVAKVYVAALYLSSKMTVSDAVLSDPGAKRIAMHILRERISADEFVAALHDGLAANNQPPELAPLETRIRDLAAMMHQVGHIDQGGTVLLDYLPGIGTRVTVNGVARITIPGADFNRALLRIWLGDRPVDGRLKQALLGNELSLLPF